MALEGIIHQINIVGGGLQRHEGCQSTQLPMKSSGKKGVIHRKKVGTARTWVNLREQTGNLGNPYLSCHLTAGSWMWIGHMPPIQNLALHQHPPKSLVLTGLKNSAHVSWPSLAWVQTLCPFLFSHLGWEAPIWWVSSDCLIKLICTGYHLGFFFKKENCSTNVLDTFYESVYLL